MKDVTAQEMHNIGFNFFKDRGTARTKKYLELARCFSKDFLWIKALSNPTQVTIYLK
jgi:hypothetical protein